MKTASLLRSVRRLQNGSIFFTNQWHGKSTLPIVISERELLHEKCIVIPEEWRLKFVYTEYSPFMIDRFYYGVRTDEYPLMWVWYWWKLRFDKSLEFLIMGLVLSRLCLGVSAHHTWGKAKFRRLEVTVRVEEMKRDWNLVRAILLNLELDNFDRVKIEYHRHILRQARFISQVDLENGSPLLTTRGLKLAQTLQDETKLNSVLAFIEEHGGGATEEIITLLIKRDKAS